jgi:hypothetical protein
MRVLVLLPTTGALNRVLRVAARPGLRASLVVMQGDYRPLAITKDYDLLTSEAGPLAALAPLAKPGPHEMRVAGPVDSGKSWELPVLLAHLVVALGAELAEEPAQADIVLWSTGAVDLDLRILDHDYKLPAKADHSKTELKEAVAAGAQIIAILPACEDASPLRDLLTEIGAGHARVDAVDNVAAARTVLEEALRHTVPAAPATDAAAAVKASGSTGSPRKIAVLLASIVAIASVAVGALAIGRDRLAQVAGFAVGVGDKVDDRSVEPGGPRPPDPAEQPRTVAEQPRTGTEQPQTVADQSRTGTEQPKTEAEQPKIEADHPKTDADHPRTGPEHSPDGNTHPAETAPADLPVPVQLAELRVPNDRSCVTVLFEQAQARRVDVALDGRDRFRNSMGRNLCGLELTLNPQSGAQGFDIDMPVQRLGFRLTSTGAPGARTKIKVEFTRELRHTITYNVQVKFGDAQPPEPMRQFRHTIIGMVE